jgi:Putative Actinobacterial Holin-X, holin superfamily III
MFTILKLFGIDVPAKMAELQARLEQRVELAKDHVRQAAQTAAVMAALFVLAGLAALSAFGVGLIALYRWVMLNYGQFYGLAAVGGVLILIAIVLLASAMLEAKSWSGEGAAEDEGKRLKRAELLKQAELQARSDRLAAQAAAALDRPAPRPVLASSPSLAPTSAGDLVEPLSLILSKVMKFPTTGNPVLDDLLLHLRGSAQPVADEAVDSVVRAVRYGDRANLIAVLGTAMIVGWVLARHRPDHAAAV